MKSSITESVSYRSPFSSPFQSFCSERLLANHKCEFGDVLCVTACV